MNRDEIIRREQEAIARSRAASQLSKWQLQAGYYLAFLNNQAQRDKSVEPITLQFTPGDSPRLTKVK